MAEESGEKAFQEQNQILPSLCSGCSAIAGAQNDRQSQVLRVAQDDSPAIAGNAFLSHVPFPESINFIAINILYDMIVSSLRKGFSQCDGECSST